MSTELVDQVPPGSLDRVGLSIITATKSTGNSRKGLIYNPTTLAGGHLIHLHPMIDGNYLAVFKEHWYDGTLTGDPGIYSDYEVDSVPYWAVITQHGTVRRSETIPTRSGDYEDRFIQAAVSRQAYLYLLETRDGDAWIQHHRVSNSAGVQLAAEEKVPSVEDIVFDRGLFINDPHICLFGTNDDGDVYVARKEWSRIGETRSFRSEENLKTPVWEYQSDKGWSVDPDEIEPITTVGGDPLTSTGPIGYAEYRNKSYISVVNPVSTLSKAQFYTSKGLYDPWKKMSEISLGTTSAQYLSGTAYLQPHLALLDGGAPGFLYTYSMKLTTSGDDKLDVVWSKLTA